MGISKLARVVDIFGKRLQTQEVMTAQIANVINEVLGPKGVAVVVNAKHQCMTTRGVHKPESSTITSTMLGTFRQNPDTKQVYELNYNQFISFTIDIFQSFKNNE